MRKRRSGRQPMTKFSYSEVQAVHDASQGARVACLSNFSMVESTLSDFTASNELTGPGWSAAKSALSPYSVVSKALYNYHCDFGETFTAFLTSFEAEVGETSKVMDTDELAELQSKIHRIQQEKQELMVKIAGNIALEIIGGYGVMYKGYQIDQAQKQVDILEKYQSFESSHAGDFTSIASTGVTLKTAFTELGKSKQFNQQTGMYTYSDCSYTDWYKTLSSYNDSCPSQRIEIVLTNRKYAENGVYLYEVYINGVYSKTASENLMYATSVEGTKALGLSVLNMAGEFTGIYDIYRFLSGKDPISGDKTSRLEAGLWTALLLLPTAKLVTAVKELKAGNKLLKGVDLTADELRILTKAGYFDDVAKIDTLKAVEKLPTKQAKAIQEVEQGTLSLTEKGNTVRKSNYGEMKMDQVMAEKGYERISLETVTDIDEPLRKGIDGVYYNPDGYPPYIIGEAKYDTSTLSKLKDGTKQMSDNWIVGDDRLLKSVGEDLYDEILKDGYDRVLVEKIKQDGSYVKTYLDEFGNKIK